MDVSLVRTSLLVLSITCIWRREVHAMFKLIGKVPDFVPIVHGATDVSGITSWRYNGWRLQAELIVPKILNAQIVEVTQGNEVVKGQITSVRSGASDGLEIGNFITTCSIPDI